jgi:hypothetical protein
MKKKTLLHGRCPMTLARTHADIKQRKIGETVENFADETERSAPKRSLQQVYELLVALGIAVSRTGSSSASAGGTYSSFAFVFFFSLSPFSRFACFPQTFAFPTLAYCGFSGDGR